MVKRENDTLGHYIHPKMVSEVSKFLSVLWRDIMESFSRSILNNAQTVYDGGIISNILKNVQLFNNSNVAKESSNFITLRMSGGYVAALVFGILWILAMISSMSYFFYFHFKRSNGVNFNHSRILRPLKLSKLKGVKNTTYSFSTILQLFAIVAIVIAVLLLTCLALVNIAYLTNSISSPSYNYVPNQTEKVTSILPALKKSLDKIRNYLSTFGDEARINTASVVEEIVEATKSMQNKTMSSFNDVLMSEIGVTKTFQYGDEMTRVVVQFFDYSTTLLQLHQEYKDLYEKLYPNAMDPDFSVFKMILLIRETIDQMPNCDEACKDFQAFFAKKFVNEASFADTDFASSFLFIMKQRNETKESIQEKSDHVRRQMLITMEKSKKRMDSLVDIPGTVRNMTMDTWTKMDANLEKAVSAIDNLSVFVSSDEISSKMSRVSVGLVFALLIPVLLVVTVVILVVALVCLGAQDLRLRVAVYSSLALLSLCLLVAMVVFLIAGTMETELCRYLRTEQPVLVTANGSRLTLDNDLNRIFVPENLRYVPKSEFPTPLPRDVLHGIVHRCRHNEPVLVALNAVDSLDTRALSKPEATKKIIDVGRQLLIESLTDTDPMKMMPVDIQDSLKQASQMDMFKAIDIDANIAKIPLSPILENRGNQKSFIATNLFIDRVEKFIYHYGPSIKDDHKRIALTQSFKILLPKLERFKLLTDKARQVYRSLRDIPKIEPIVGQLQTNLATMLTTMNNKTYLLEIANRLYDDIIVKSTPENVAAIMAKFGPIMMGKLGHCRPLFDAYESTVDTTCDIVVAKMNAYWLYLGTIVLLVTIFLATVLMTVLRSTPWFSRPSLTVPVHTEHKTLEDRLLSDPINGDHGDRDDQERTMV